MQEAEEPLRPVDDLALFCEAQYPSLVGLLSFYCHDGLIAEELAQETLIQTCRDWRQVRAMENPDRWVRRVAINLAKSHFRRRSAERRAKERLEGRAQATGEADVDWAMTVRAAILQLPHRQRSVLLLRFFYDLPFAEVAETLQLPVGTVKAIAHRATRRLHRELDEANPKEAAHGR